MGRLTQAVRRTRADPQACDRVTAARRGPTRTKCMRKVVIVARDAGRSSYFRPLFDRPRQWAAQRTPRAAPSALK